MPRDGITGAQPISLASGGVVRVAVVCLYLSFCGGKPVDFAFHGDGFGMSLTMET
jgi:hypothetical protein